MREYADSGRNETNGRGMNGWEGKNDGAMGRGNDDRNDGRNIGASLRSRVLGRSNPTIEQIAFPIPSAREGQAVPHNDGLRIRLRGQAMTGYSSGSRNETNGSGMNGWEGRGEEEKGRRREDEMGRRGEDERGNESGKEEESGGIARKDEGMMGRLGDGTKGR